MKAVKTCVFLSVLLFFLPSCSSPKVQDRKVILGAQRLGITEEQYIRFMKYLVYRDRATLYIHLAPNASAEEIRMRVASRLELPKDSTWESFLTNKLIRTLLTDERRLRFTEYFGLSTNSSWIELKDYLEGLREKNRIRSR